MKTTDTGDYPMKKDEGMRYVLKAYLVGTPTACMIRLLGPQVSVSWNIPKAVTNLHLYPLVYNKHRNYVKNTNLEAKSMNEKHKLL